ncbi:hypothetical protein PTTG_04991 [Puccinia triticina 1-1 BBBD Race 1]|uniref:RRF domain-containing protein n=2 Tax=Puccinia triticina TaxID=208348 RepID=A0A0C4EW04_PUCT1|nr:uncharacterized protein PtA15_2A836 [Puccinia triticina]OAV92652.1 hypothetical protein PTTG_04991 [Puccinia triticina 1-1 BBBD Race 1]WAQ82519.1 hypothetical protein PtA15_2A836 [Puccinia triticina]
MLSRPATRLARLVRFSSSPRIICTRPVARNSLGGRSISSSAASWAKKKGVGNSTGKPSHEDVSKVSPMENQDGMAERFNRNQVEKEMDMAVARLRQGVNLIVNRVGRLTPAFLDGIKVMHDQQRLGMSSVAQVVVLDSNTLSVVPYDPSFTKSIEQALYGSTLNLAPKLQADGSLSIAIPRLTIDTRKVLAKESGELCEQARAGIRNIRQAAQKASRTDLDSNLITKDDFKDNQKALDNLSKTYGKLVDGIETKSKAVLLDK